MVHLLIKHQDISKVTIKENYTTYRLSYIYPYTTISGIPLHLENIDIIDKLRIYKIIINDKITLQKIQEIDILLSTQIPTYISFLKYENDIWYIVFKKNNTVIDKLKDKLENTSLSINIMFVKKGASYNYPIVYLL